MSNQFANTLLEIIEDRFSVDASDMSTSEWMCKNTTLKKKKFSFEGYEFQRQIADDMHPNLSVIKISQVGLTEIQIRKALAFLIRNTGTSLIFSLPNDDMYERVSKARMKPVINNDKVFNSHEDRLNKSVRSTPMYQFGQSFLYVVAALESAATSIDADFVMNDEIDLSNQASISLFNSRLQGSDYRISQKFSTPTFPAFGIDLEWNMSDQHHYMSRCQSCGTWQQPEFNHKYIHLPNMPEVQNLTDITSEFQDVIDLKEAYVKCRKCHNRLDLDSDREWVAKHPNRTENRGYKVSPFVSTRLDVPYIFQRLWKYQTANYERGFYNTVLGIPYASGDMQIPIADIEACLTTNASPARLANVIKPLWLGIDVGQACHLVIGQGYNEDDIDIIDMYQVKASDLEDHVAKLVNDHNFAGGCIDRHPYTPTAEAIFKRTGGKILPVEYRGMKDVNPILNEYGTTIHAQVNHLWFLDSFATRIRKRNIRISGYRGERVTYKDHLRNMIRDEQPMKPAQWIKLNNEDHYFHASAFMTNAKRIHELCDMKSKYDSRSLNIAGVYTPEASKTTPGLLGSTNKILDANGNRML